MVNVWIRLAAITLAVCVTSAYGQRKQPTAVVPLRQLSTYEYVEETTMAVHRWSSTDGDVGAATSWDSATAPSVAATGVLTLTGQPLNTETVVLDSKTYTFQTSLTDVDGNVLIGATASDSLDNLIAAITLGAGAGSTYAASMTLHPTVTAAAGAGDTMDVTAKVKGTAGNSIATTEGLTNGSFGGGTLSGGTQWAATDTGLFDGALSNVAASSGLDQSTINIANIISTPEYTGQIGLSGTRLQFNAGNWVLRSPTIAYIEPQATSAIVIVESANTAGAVELYGSVGKVFVRKGRVTVTSGTSINAFGIMGTFSATDAAHLIIAGTSVDGPQFVYVVGGRVDNYRLGMSHADHYSLYIVGPGGTLRQYGAIESTSGNPPWLVNMGGVIDMRATDVAQTTTVHWASGHVDLRNSTEDFASLADSFIGPTAQITETPVREADDIGFDLVDLRKDYP